MKKIMILFVIAILFSSCVGDGDGSIRPTRHLTADNADFILPFEAENVVDKGNGWIQFDLDENTYLFLYQQVGGGGRATAITQVK